MTDSNTPTQEAILSELRKARDWRNNLVAAVLIVLVLSALGWWLYQDAQCSTPAEYLTKVECLDRRTP
jgi:cytochrome c-type biogenesis protein CcmH/NrfG